MIGVDDVVDTTLEGGRPGQAEAVDQVLSAVPVPLVAGCGRSEQEEEGIVDLLTIRGDAGRAQDPGLGDRA